MKGAGSLAGAAGYNKYILTQNNSTERLGAGDNEIQKKYLKNNNSNHRE